MSDSRGDVDLVGHQVVFVPNPAVGPLPEIKNIIVTGTNADNQWVEAATSRIGKWRARLSSTYLRWSLAINGLQVAAERYADPGWINTHKSFIVRSLRPVQKEADPQGRPHVDNVVIAEWDGHTASQAHRNTIPMLAAFGIIDLYANLEEVVFDLYKLFLNARPELLLKGNEFKELRRLKREADVDASKRESWQAAWDERLIAWQRNRLYDGLGKVFKAFCDSAGLKTPSEYTVTTVETWAESIDIVAMVRNALVHGASRVSADLAAACTKPHAMTFRFKKDDPLVINLLHLQGVDLFCEQLMTSLNLSMVELIAGKAK
jgi:hypothetical protein